MTVINELIARWDTAEGRPYKGSLIDMEAYEADPDNIGCMCAQGQVLHLVGGWSQDRLNTESQAKADAETAKLLNISRAHAVLLRTINDNADGAPSVVLTDLGAVLGEKWSEVLDFWRYLDGLTQEEWDAAWVAAWDAAEDAAEDVAWDAARDAAWVAARDAAWVAARDAARDAVGVAAEDAAEDAAGVAAGATNEIQGADILREKGQPLLFLPAFGFATPSDIPPRPDGYGPFDRVSS